MATKREPWIDLVKGIAILAVLVDHTFGHEPRIGRSLCVAWSYFSVALFVLIGGYNAGRTQARHVGDSFWASVPWRGIRRLLGAYLVAVGIFHVVGTQSFVLSDYLRSVVSFNSVGAFYFVAFYVQLLALSPVLYRSLCRCPWLALAAVALAAHWMTRHTLVFEQAYGAGKFLLGGYFLLAYALGMALSLWPQPRRRVSCLLGLGGLALSLALGAAPVKSWICSASGKLGFVLYNLNPSGGLWLLVALSVFLVVRAIPLSPRCLESLAMKALLAVGRESMMIFLYHILVLMALDRVIPWAHPLVGGADFLLAASVPVIGVSVFRRGVRWWKEGRA